MEGSIRVSAKTVDDAITEALIQLGVTSDRLEYEVIEKGSAGFLGIGMKQAVIEARRKKDDAEETVDDFKKEIEKEFKKDFSKENKKEFRKDFKKENKQSQKAPEKEIVKEEVKKEVKEEIKEEIKEDTSEKEVKKEVKETTQRRNVELAEVTEETVKAVETFLKETLQAMGMSVEIESTIEDDGSLNVDMKGDNMGILIGKRGQTLDSLQYLANRVANKHQSGYVRVKLDTENYRSRREETLKHLAKNIAHKVKRNRRPVALEPMNPYERRIIHSALQSDPYVTTHSEGEEPYRKVVVTLKR